MLKLKYFFWGILAAGGALVSEIIFLIFSGEESLPDIFWQKISLFLVAFVFLEEFFKFIFIKKIVLEERGGCQETFFLGAGFAFLEMTLNLLKGLPEGQMWGNISSLLGVFAVHILTAMAAGKMLSVSGKKISWPIQAKILSALFLLHFLYNIAIINLF